MFLNINVQVFSYIDLLGFLHFIVLFSCKKENLVLLFEYLGNKWDFVALLSNCTLSNGIQFSLAEADTHDYDAKNVKAKILLRNSQLSPYC